MLGSQFLIIKHIVPCCIEGDFNENTYPNLLQECVDHIITENLENEDNPLENEITFRHDGACPHFNIRESF